MPFRALRRAGWAARVPAGFTFALSSERFRTRTGYAIRVAGPLFFIGRGSWAGSLGRSSFSSGRTHARGAAALAEFLPQLPLDLQFAVEFRQRGWISDDTLALLADHTSRCAHRRALDSRPGRCSSWRSIRRRFRVRAVDGTQPRHHGTISHIQFDRTRELEAWSETLRGWRRG